MAIDFPAGPGLNQLYTDPSSGNIYKCIQVSPSIVWTFGGTIDPGETTDLTGSIGYFAYDATGNLPLGWIQANGASVNTYDYRALHSRLSNLYGGTAYQQGVTDQPTATTTFRIPDLRDQFIRGSSDSRSVGDTEQDTIGSHEHNIIDPGHFHLYSQQPHFNMPGHTNPSTAGQNANQNSTPATTTEVTGITIDPFVGGDETRPINTVLFACIHY